MVLADPIVIVGSGATAVHFAQTALEMGRRVVMLDVGHAASAHALPDASLNQLKSQLEDPAGYFLGENFESVILPDDDSEFYGFPPSKSYVFQGLKDYAVESKGFAPLMSFATGGLAQAWTGGCYPFNEGELEAFPFGWAEMAPAYGEVAARIGVSGAIQDDLSPYYPAHDGLMAPVNLDAHSEQLFRAYQRRRHKLNESHGFFMGRARIAALSHNLHGRKACSFTGRCLWGCPS
jgi:hypothetical protein